MTKLLTKNIFKKNIFKKSILNFGWVVLFAIALSAPGLAQQNLVAGTGPLTNAIANWSNRSAINLISGSTLFPASGKNTLLFMAFAQGDEVDIGGMVLYTTDRNHLLIRAVTPLTFHGFSAGAFFLHSACSGRISVQTPCALQLDPIPFMLSPFNDYYAVIYFKTSVNNAAVDSATSLNSNTSLFGGIDSGKDDTTFRAGDVLPPNIVQGSANFLVRVISN
jgi:hypothetical protein